MKWDHYLGFLTITTLVFLALVKIHFQQEFWLEIILTAIFHGFVGTYFYNLFYYERHKIFTPLLIVISVSFAVASPYFFGFAGFYNGLGNNNKFEYEQILFSIPIANLGIWLVFLVKKVSEIKIHTTHKD